MDKHQSCNGETGRFYRDIGTPRQRQQLVQLAERSLVLAFGEPEVVDRELESRMTLGNAVQQMQVRVLRHRHDRHAGFFRFGPQPVEVAFSEQRPQERPV